MGGAVPEAPAAQLVVGSGSWCEFGDPSGQAGHRVLGGYAAGAPVPTAGRHHARDLDADPVSVRPAGAVIVRVELSSMWATTGLDAPRESLHDEIRLAASWCPPLATDR